MAKVNGKQKGNAFEREIANKLSERFADKLGIKSGFRRNPDSGSFFGGTNASRMDDYDLDYAIYGDLICPKSFKFCIECKNYKTPPSLNGVLNESIKEWDEWIEQNDKDAEKDNKMSFLVVKYNRTEVFVVLNGSLDFGIQHQISYKDRKVYKLSDILDLPDHYFF